MGYVEKLAVVAFKYHAEMLDVNRALHVLGLRSDERAEQIGKKHAMKIVKDIWPVLGIDLLKEE